MDFKEQLTVWRQYLHQHPETAFEEKKAPQLVAEQMRAWGIQVEEGIGRTGVVGTLRCGNGGGCIGIRADMDALDITERSCHDHISLCPEKMHGCGHDGHTVMLLGAAQGMRILGAPVPGDPRVISGESGEVTSGFVCELYRNKEQKPLREELGLDKDSRVLCISTEGATDWESYRRIVWDGTWARG